MTDGEIGNNTAAKNFGGGVCIGIGEFSVSGGEISGNIAAMYGGGVYKNKGTVTLGGSAKITGNTAVYGGGVYNNNGTVTLGGSAKITGNTAAMYGGGVYYNNGTVTLGGEAKITGNKKGTDEAAVTQNVYLLSGKTITLGTGTAVPKEGMEVGVTMEDVTGPFTTNGTAEEVKYFTSDNKTLAVTHVAKEPDHLEMVKSWTALQDALNGQTTATMDGLFEISNGTITLLTDFTAATGDKTLTVGETKTFDLNGRVINANGVTTVGSVITVPENANLTLQDSGNTEHYFTVGENGQWTLTEIKTENTKTVTGGIITGGTGTYVSEPGGASDYHGGGVSVEGNFIMNGGTIVGNRVSNAEVMTLGGGVFVGPKAEFTMNDGVICGNSVDGCYALGGGVDIDPDGMFTMTGGTVSGNTALYGAGIQNNAMYGKVGTVKLLAAEGKTITITENTATEAEGGVANWGVMYLSGTVIIKDNTCTAKYDDTINRPVNLATDNGIIIDGALTGSEISITHANGDEDTHDTGVLTSGFANSKDDAKLGDFFTYDGPSTFAMILNSDNELAVVKTWTALESALDGTTTTTVPGLFEINDGTIKLLTDFTAEEGDERFVVPVGKDIVLDLNGFTVDRGLTDEESAVIKGNIFTVNGKLTIEDNSDGHTGKITGGTSAYGAAVISNGDTVLKSGSIVGCKAISETYDKDRSVNGRGGAIYVSGNGTFTMNGGEISNCSASVAGGAIFNAGTVNITGGSISGCSASGVDDDGTVKAKGGAVYNYGCSSFTMEGGEISGNTLGNVQDMRGAGVYAAAGADITLGGKAVITGNTDGGSENSNVFLYDGVTITLGTGEGGNGVAAPVTTGDKIMSIGVTMQTAGQFTAESSGAKAAEDCFTSDSTDYVVRYNNKGTTEVMTDDYLELVRSYVITNNTTEKYKDTNGGFIAIDQTSALEYDTITVTVTPNVGYKLSSLKYNDGSSDQDIISVSGVYSFVMPAAKVSVTATFAEKSGQTITADSSQSFTYGDTGKSITASTSGDGALSYAVKESAAADVVEVNGSTGALTIKKTGETTITITAEETDNYKGATKDVTVKVSKKAINKPTENTEKFTYSGSEQTYNPVGFDANTMNISGNKQTDANENGYTVKVTPKDNYVWSTEGDCQFTWVIDKAAITNISVAQTGTLTYTGQAQTATVSASATTVNSQTASFTYCTTESGTYTANVPAFTAAGEHTVYYKVSAPNHGEKGGTFTVKIARAPVQAPTIESKVYTGKKLTADVDCTDKPYTVTTNDGGTAVGNYNVVLTLSDTTNYKWSDSDEAGKTLTFMITRADNAWTTEPKIDNVTYGTAISPVYAAKFGTVVVTYEGTGDTEYASPTTAPTKAGTYKATFKVTGTTDYTELTKDVTFTIGKKQLTVTGTAVEETRVYDGTKVAKVTAEGSLTNAVEGDDITLGATAAFADANAGENKTVTVTYTITGDDAGNYTAPVNNTSLTASITKANVPAPLLKDSVTIDYKAETIAPKARHELSTQSGEAFEEGKITVETAIDFTKSYYIRKAEDENHFASAELTYTPLHPAAPSGFTAKEESIENKKDGTFSGITSAMEYHKNGGEWISGPGTLSGLSDETITVRTKATDEAFKSLNYTYTFTASTGKLTVTMGEVIEKVPYDGLVTKPADPVREGFAFGGWYTEKACITAWNFAVDTVKDNMTLYPKWIKNEEKKALIGGNVTEDGVKVPQATVELFLGTEKIAATVTDDDGNYKFDNVKLGTYNIVVTKTEGGNTKTKTELVTVDKTGEFSADVKLPKGDVNSVVEHKPGETSADAKTDVSQTVVGGLDEIAENETPSGTDKITIKLKVEPKKDEETAKQKDIKKEAGEGKKVEFLDLSLVKQVNAGKEEDIGDKNDTLLTIVIPFDFTNVEIFSVMILRNHGGKVEKITTSKNDKGECLTKDYAAGTLTIHAMKFSDYAIAYSEVTKPDPSDDESDERHFTAYAEPVANATAISGSWQYKEAEDTWYYIVDGSSLKNGWYYLANPYSKTVKTGWFCFDEAGRMQRGWILSKLGHWFFTHDKKDGDLGRLETGWHKDEQDGLSYYLDLQTGRMYTGWHTFSGVWYYFTETSEKTTWRQDEKGRWVATAAVGKPLGSLDPAATK